MRRMSKVPNQTRLVHSNALECAMVQPGAASHKVNLVELVRCHPTRPPPGPEPAPDRQRTPHLNGNCPSRSQRTPTADPRQNSLTRPLLTACGKGSKNPPRKPNQINGRIHPIRPFQKVSLLTQSLSIQMHCLMPAIGQCGYRFVQNALWPVGVIPRTLQSLLRLSFPVEDPPSGWIGPSRMMRWQEERT